MSLARILRAAALALAAAGLISPALAACPGAGADWARNWNARQKAATLALYTPDAVFVDPSGKRFDGLKAIRTLFDQTLATYRADLRMDCLARGIAGDSAFESGTFEETLTTIADGKAAHYSGAWLLMLRRAGKRWLIERQVWTADSSL